MKELNLEIEIHAPREKVWESIVNDQLYRQWASEFQEGSYFEGSWNKGDTLRFIAIDESGNKGGMISDVVESDYPSFISLLNKAMYNENEEEAGNDLITEFTPGFEKYTLEAIGNDKTLFKLNMEVEDDFYDMMLEMWSKAMHKLKEVSER